MSFRWCFHLSVLSEKNKEKGRLRRYKRPLLSSFIVLTFSRLECLEIAAYRLTSCAAYILTLQYVMAAMGASEAHRRGVTIREKFIIFAHTLIHSILLVSIHFVPSSSVNSKSSFCMSTSNEPSHILKVYSLWLVSIIILEGFCSSRSVIISNTVLTLIS